MIGIDFHKADISKREPLSFTQNQVTNLLPKLASGENVLACALLATCNRTELYLHTKENIDALNLLSNCANLNKNDYKTIARHEVKLNIDQICMTAKTLLKNGGIIGLVHRPERLTDIIKTMRNYNLEPKKIQFVHPRPDENANIVLIESVLNGKPGVKILPPLISHQANGEYTDQIKKYFE